MKLIKEVKENLIIDEIDASIVELLKEEQTIKTLAKYIMDNYNLNIEVALDRVNNLLYTLYQNDLIVGYKK